jgi:DNA-binding SARP family transcriptional activator
MPMEFRILGPLEVLEEDDALALGKLKERMVLAVLLLHANEFVSRERLIDELWGLAPPATANKAVNVYISKLRKTLGGNGHDPIATADGGYRLVVDPGLLDAERMRSLVASARERMAEGQTDPASQLLQEALTFWRGPTLAGIQLESVGRDEVAQLDELRLSVLMDRIDCDLAEGRHEHVLGELNVLVREHPLRERLRAQQMLALYRADRQADALEAYQQARHALTDELGIEPSESLQRLQQAILQHDPALEVPAGTAAANGAPQAPVVPEDVGPALSPARSRTRRPALRRRYLVVAGLAAVAVVAAVAAFLSTRSGSPPAPSSSVSSVSPNTIAILNAATRTQIADPSGLTTPGPMAVDGNILWIVARGSGLIVPYDVRTPPPGTGPPPFSAGDSPYAVAAAGGHAWVSERKPVVFWIRRVGSDKGRNAPPPVTSQNIRVRGLKTAGAEAVGGGDLWVIPGPNGTGNRVALINVRNPRSQSTVSVGLGRQTSAIAYGYGSAWVGTYDPQHDGIAYLTKVGPRSDQPPSLELETGDGEGPLAVAVGEGDVWVLTAHGNLIEIDPKTLQIMHTTPMSHEQPEWLTVGDGFVWTANYNHNNVSQIDPRTNTIVHTTPPLGRYDARPCGIAATHAEVFVAFGETTCG